MGVMSGNSIEEPMHYGEVFAAWSYLSATKGEDCGISNHAESYGG
ncbi:hypothetical protein GCM10007416_27500 [Kroppenstedtia guangzhouensis]|uniref:Uncharacterized protein n=1 Tax=Kroppenstedtia guangzhouensis TaxID=1274356 RepID=A0ABQ1GYG4_9BACL|nr:hypothetical protein GCM10007416_27500 [Kroppenstedtia guangzhouensis]